MNGFELIKQLKAGELFNDIPIVVLSGGKSGDVDQANPVQNDHPKLTSNIFFKEVVHSC
jgi:CheY-like chemotaxis protein